MPTKLGLDFHFGAYCFDMKEGSCSSACFTLSIVYLLRKKQERLVKNLSACASRSLGLVVATPVKMWYNVGFADLAAGLLSPGFFLSQTMDRSLEEFHCTGNLSTMATKEKVDYPTRKLAPPVPRVGE